MALAALAPHLPRYQRSVAAYARLLVGRRPVPDRRTAGPANPAITPAAVPGITAVIASFGEGVIRAWRRYRCGCRHTREDLPRLSQMAGGAARGPLMARPERPGLGAGRPVVAARAHCGRAMPHYPSVNVFCASCLRNDAGRRQALHGVRPAFYRNLVIFSSRQGTMGRRSDEHWRFASTTLQISVSLPGRLRSCPLLRAVTRRRDCLPAFPGCKNREKSREPHLRQAARRLPGRGHHALAGRQAERPLGLARDDPHVPGQLGNMTLGCAGQGPDAGSVCGCGAGSDERPS